MLGGCLFYFGQGEYDCILNRSETGLSSENDRYFEHDCLRFSSNLTLDFDCAYFQWHKVPESFNLGDDPNSCIRVDTELRPNGPNHADVPPVPNVPWGTRKL